MKSGPSVGPVAGALNSKAWAIRTRVRATDISKRLEAHYQKLLNQRKKLSCAPPPSLGKNLAVDDR
jgi:hypothetical protein